MSHHQILLNLILLEKHIRDHESLHQSCCKEMNIEGLSRTLIPLLIPFMETDNSITTKSHSLAENVTSASLLLSLLIKISPPSFTFLPFFPFLSAYKNTINLETF